MVLISSLAVPKWMRENIINGVELVIAFEAHLVFYLLMQPSKANKNFPFHVRTTQIGVMDKEKETGDGTLDRFSSYPYAPSNTGNNTRIQTVSNNQAMPAVSASDMSVLDHSHPILRNGLEKRHHSTNIIPAVTPYAFPPGFITDGVGGANNLIESEHEKNSTILNNRRNKEIDKHVGWQVASQSSGRNDYGSPINSSTTTTTTHSLHNNMQDHDLKPVVTHVQLKEVKPDKDI